MKERVSQEVTDHGEVLRWSSNSEAEVELLEQNKESGLADKAVSEDETKFGWGSVGTFYYQSVRISLPILMYGRIVMYGKNVPMYKYR